MVSGVCGDLSQNLVLMLLCIYRKIMAVKNGSRFLKGGGERKGEVERNTLGVLLPPVPMAMCLKPTLNITVSSVFIAQ